MLWDQVSRSLSAELSFSSSLLASVPCLHARQAKKKTGLENGEFLKKVIPHFQYSEEKLIASI